MLPWGYLGFADDVRGFLGTATPAGPLLPPALRGVVSLLLLLDDEGMTVSLDVLVRTGVALARRSREALPLPLAGGGCAGFSLFLPEGDFFELAPLLFLVFKSANSPNCFWSPRRISRAASLCKAFRKTIQVVGVN